MPVIPVLGRLRQEELQFKASCLGYLENLIYESKNQKTHPIHGYFTQH